MCAVGARTGIGLPRQREISFGSERGERRERDLLRPRAASVNWCARAEMKVYVFSNGAAELIGGANGIQCEFAFFVALL